MALGFEKMSPGSLSATYTDRTNPLSQFVSSLSEKHGLDKSPLAPQIFGRAGMEYCEKYPQTQPIHMDLIGVKNHFHSTLNPYSQFRTPYTLDQIQKSRHVFGPLSMLECCPTSNGAG